MKARACLTCKHSILITSRKTGQSFYYCRLHEKIIDPSDLCSSWES